MIQNNKVFLGSDHRGYELKEYFLKELREIAELVDCGCGSQDSVDYPDYAKEVCQAVADNNQRGILICGSGVGMCMAANKVPGIRAALAWDVNVAELSRRHNDSNVLCLGADFMEKEIALEVARKWLKTSFEGGRHQRRVDLIAALEPESEQGND